MSLVNLDEFEKVFLGNCFGVGLSPRGDDDLAVEATILVEDDGNWFKSDNPFSSYWVDDIVSVLKEAKVWMKKHCDKEPKGFGFVFRTKD